MDDREKAKALERLNNLTHLLDNSIRIPVINYRIGLDALVGLIPGVGDVLTLLPSSYILYQGARLGMPRKTLALMAYNVGLEALVGAIPVVGDIFDAVWKANARNMHLIEKHVEPFKGSEPPSKRGLIAFITITLLILIGGIVALAYAVTWLIGLIA